MKIVSPADAKAKLRHYVHEYGADQTAALRTEKSSDTKDFRKKR
jgi:hypothetical protein